MSTLRLLRTSDRNAPDGTWRSGDAVDVPLDQAAELLASGLFVLPDDVDKAAVAGLIGDTQTASLDGGATPAGEPASRAPARKRGRS